MTTKREAVLKTFYSKRAVSRAFGWSMEDAGILCKGLRGARGETIVAKYARADEALAEKAILLLAGVGVGGWSITEGGRPRNTNAAAAAVKRPAPAAAPLTQEQREYLEDLDTWVKNNPEGPREVQR